MTQHVRIRQLGLQLCGLIGLFAGSACDAAPTATPERASTGPGSLVETRVITDIDESISALRATAVRVLYRSTSGRDGSSTMVSGMVFVPAGTPPAGGWPVLAQAHGTTGINNDCGPSLSRNMLGAAPMMAQFLKAGFAVAAADYEGLGAPGIHLYLDAKTAAWNVIDSVRALRHVQPGSISERWLVFGGSQGGAAAWAVAEQAWTYAPELPLLGAVAFVPPTDFSAYAQQAFDGSFNAQQSAAYIAMLASQSRVHPELDLDLYRRGSVTTNWQALLNCSGSHQQERAEALKQVTMDELQPATPEAARAFGDLLARLALPHQRAQAPLLVIYAGKDQFIDPEWTRVAIEKACAMGSRIQAVYQPNKDHGADWSMVPMWLQQRLDGKPFQDTCGE
jgi:pimeloyl-ACP methyl ester carboxylesterase